MKPNLELHIEELVLNGFPAGDRDGIAAAVQDELSRLLTEQGVPSPLERGGEYPLLKAPPLPIDAGYDAHSIGRQVAATVYQAMQPETSSGKGR